MLRIILAGCNGRMGRSVTEFCCNQQDLKIVAGYAKNNSIQNSYPVFTSLMRCTVEADVLVDFSHPEAIHQLLPYCISHHLPAVLGVTGYSQAQLEEIMSASTSIPIFRAANFSIGANVLLKLTASTAALLGNEFDTAIVERHHKSKLDAPSGTALFLSYALHKAPEISSIRAGTTAGEHTVLFVGPDELLTLSHRADTRTVYAAGAIRAAQFIACADSPGLYSMENLLNS